MFNMQTVNFKKMIFGWFFAVLVLPGFLRAEDIRTLPLDMYLIVDGSSRISEAKNETAAWIGEQIIERMLKDGDSLTLWSAGPEARLLFSETLGGANGKDEVKAKLKDLEASGSVADFSGALRDAAARAARGEAGRLAYTMVVSASAESLAPALTGKDANLFRWSRVEEYSRFRILVVAPDIHGKVRQAAAAYMNSGR
jgi:hypothetical protein